MAIRPVYSVDSSALIHGWRRAYRPKNFASVWARFDVLIDEGRLRSSIEVYNELEKKTMNYLSGARIEKRKYL
jgi:Domain of unknown function (DUF4411)